MFKLIVGAMMAAVLLSATTASALASVVPQRLAATASADPGVILSLGDSLAVGLQPAKFGFRPTLGYAGVVAEQMSKLMPGIKLVRYGCAGATTTSFIRGGPCPFSNPPYGRGSQLIAAERFITANRGRVKLVMIDIGANDVVHCARANFGPLKTGCLAVMLPRVRKNVALIAQRLRQAAGPSLRLVGLNYYNPFLAAYVQGGKGRSRAMASVSLIRNKFNDRLVQAYRQHGFVVADVARAFGSDLPFSTMTVLSPYGRIPASVANICKHTWACDRRSDIHARDSGYGLMAAAVLTAT
ncbi:MAG TPA: SGNH/GDSL hydrolase family protein [Candidatus Saccharimonadia bacterium]